MVYELTQQFQAEAMPSLTLYVVIGIVEQDRSELGTWINRAPRAGHTVFRLSDRSWQGSLVPYTVYLNKNR